MQSDHICRALPFWKSLNIYALINGFVDYAEVVQKAVCDFISSISVKLLPV